MGIGHAVAAAFACSLCIGCTDVPFNAPRVNSFSTDVALAKHTGTRVERELAAHPGQSALVPLADGNDALGARLRLIETAQHSIDMQYFLLKPDLAGAVITLALLEAADRGVRVRVLLDDVFTTATDAEIAILDAHPNVETRLLNPLSRSSPKFWNFLVDFGRVNRRMHNKSMTVDRSTGIVGGRNLADEYYRVDTSAEFADFDMFLAGPVVQEIADQFDIYWNDPLAVPLAALATVEPQTLAEIRDRLEARQATALQGLYQRAVTSSYLADVRSGAIQPYFADVHVSHDLPDKLTAPVVEGDRILAEDLLASMAAARQEVLLVTPYFVPEDWGARFFSELAARGVRVRVVTNSLASTNHAYVHAGYKRHRKDLLEAGVEIHEIRSDAIAVTTGNEDAAKVTMHTKLALVDGRKLFVGSLNFDPRSIKLNTEFGIFVDDPELGAEVRRRLVEKLAPFTYSVRPTTAGNLAWVYDDGASREVLFSEPDASFWKKLIAEITGLLPIEGQL